MARIKGITIEIDGETKGLNKALEDVNKRSRDVQRELRQVDRLLKFNPGNTELIAQKQKLLREQVEATREKLNRLKDAQEQVTEAFKRGEISEEQYRAFQREIIETESKLKHLEKQLEQSQTKLDKFGDKAKKAGEKLKNVGDKMTDVGKDLSMKVTAPIVGLGTLATKTAIDFESAFAGVRKTVSASEKQFAALEKGIRDMSKELPASATEIAAVAEAAGQLGIETDNILGFTRVMIDLGEATNLTAEQAATELARFANITQMSQKDFDRLGSSIVALGNNFATTEAEIVEMGMRLAGAGNQIGLTEAQIMALATALSSVGIEAEAGGSAMSAVMKKMQNAVSDGGKTLEKFAEAAGLSSKEFADVFKKEPIRALDLFIKGLAASSAAGENLNEILAEVGIKGIRESDAILRLAGASDILAEAVDLSTKAWEENTALSDEAAQRYATTESQLKMLKNTLVDLGIDIGNIIIPALLKLIEMVKPLVEWFGNLDKRTQTIIVAIAGLAAAIGPVLIVLGTLVNSVGTLLTAVPKVISFIKGLSGVFAAAKGAAAVFAGAIGAISTPVWIIIGAITALIAIGVALWKNWDKIKEFAKDLWDKLVTGFTFVKDKVVEFFTEKIPEALGNFTDKVKEVFTIVKDAVVGFFTETVPEYFGMFVDFITELPSIVLDFLGKLFLEDIPYWVGYGIGILVKTVDAGIKNVIEFFKELPGKVKEFLVETVTRAIEWRNEMRQKALDAGKEFLAKVVEFFKELPGRVKEFLVNTITRAIEWRNEMRAKAIEAGTNFLNNVVNFVKQLPGRIKEFLSNAIKNIIEFAKNAKNKALEAGKNIFDSIVDTVKKIPGQMLSLGKDIITGLINGVKNSIGSVVGIAKDIAGNFIGGFKRALGIASPSKVMMDMAKFILEGLGIGLEKDENSILKQAKEFVENLTDIFDADQQIGLSVDESVLHVLGGRLKNASIALADGTAVVVNNDKGGTDNYKPTEIKIVIENMNVRNDDDINKISRELQRLIERARRGKGGGI